MTQPRLFRSTQRRPRGRVTKGADDTVKALRDMRRLEDVDAAAVALFREAAAQLQAAVMDPDESRYTRGVLIARYQATFALLPLGHSDDDDAGALAALFADVGDGPQP